MSEKKRISANDFKKLMIENYFLKGYTIEEDLVLHKQDIIFKHYFFNTINIEGSIYIITRKKALKLYFSDVNVSDKLILEDSLISSLNLSGTKIENSLFLNFVDIKEKFSLANNSVINGSILSSNSNVFGQFEIDNSEIKKNIEFQNNSEVSSFEIKNTELTGRINADVLEFKSILINNSTLKNTLVFWNCDITNLFSVHNSEFKDSLKFEACAINHLYIKNSYLYNLWLSMSSDKLRGRKILSKTTDSITIKDSAFENNLWIEDPFISPGKVSVYGLKLQFGEKMKGCIRIGNINLGQLKLSGSNNSSEVTFDETKIDKVFVEDFSNFKTVSFFKLAPIHPSGDIRLSIRKSNLGKTQFHYCDLAAYKENIEIDQTSLVDIVPTGVNWFKYKDLMNHENKQNEYFWIKLGRGIRQLIFYSIYNSKLNDIEVVQYKKVRELFRQLKTVMERQANRIQALQFKQYEMQAYKEELKRTKRFYNRERIILWANQSNNHGQNWLKPILLAIGFSFILISFTTFSVYEDWWSLNTIWENIKHYPRMMNPAFSLKSIFGESKNFSFGANLWALLQRISMSFFIYQTVVAFRKYGKG